MSFASDKLYNGYLRQNMPTIVSKVKVREIVPYLPCLTTHDRENIEAKRETSGNFNAMVLLLECLKRRENWPEQFIQALGACEHTKLAAEIKKEYDSLLLVNNPSSGSAAATVVRAHVHPAPAASQLPDSESDADVQPDPPKPASQSPAPVHAPAQRQVPQMAADSPPEPISEPPARDELPRLPSTPPPSPEMQHAAEGKHAPHQEPEENSESEIQVPSGDTAAGRKEAAATVVVVTSRQEQQQQHPVPQSGADPLQTAATTKPSLSLTSVSSDLSDGSSVLTLTPEKHPVQDTTPPAHEVPLQPQMSAEHTAAQAAKSRPQSEVSSSLEPFANKRNGFHQDADDNSVCLSKPGQLVSVQPVNHHSPPVQPQSSTLQPYSGDSGRLELSNPSSELPSCTAQVEKPDSAEPRQENRIVPDHSEPEENHYESPNQSFDVVENVVHVAEMPSILNCDGQAPEPQLQIVNGEPAKGSFAATVNAADDTASSFNNLHSESYAPIESKPLPNSEKTTPLDPSDGQSTTRKYILIGAGVGVCALLMALKFKR